MKLDWQRDPNSPHRYVAETVRFRFVMIAPLRRKVELWVQLSIDEWNTKPIDRRTCRSRKSAERMAQRFENNLLARRLR